MRMKSPSDSRVKSDLDKVVAAVNSLPELRSEKDLFNCCTGAIDGIAIRVNARTREVCSQTKFYNESNNYK